MVDADESSPQRSVRDTSTAPSAAMFRQWAEVAMRVAIPVLLGGQAFNLNWNSDIDNRVVVLETQQNTAAAVSAKADANMEAIQASLETLKIQNGVLGEKIAGVTANIEKIDRRLERGNGQP